MRLALLLLLLGAPALAQTSPIASTNLSAARAAQVRLGLIQNRRVICGKILQALPQGLVVDSGYTNLLHSPWNRSWLVPGAVNAERAANLVEGRESDSVCVGLVFLTGLPGKKTPKVYDYVNLEGFPCGQYTYTSVGGVQRAIRQFSHKLEPAVQFRLRENEKQNTELK